MLPVQRPYWRGQRHGDGEHFRESTCDCNTCQGARLLKLNRRSQVFSVQHMGIRDSNQITRFTSDSTWDCHGQEAFTQLNLTSLTSPHPNCAIWSEGMVPFVLTFLGVVTVLTYLRSQNPGSGHWLDLHPAPSTPYSYSCSYSSTLSFHHHLVSSLMSFNSPVPGRVRIRSSPPSVPGLTLPPSRGPQPSPSLTHHQSLYTEKRWNTQRELLLSCTPSFAKSHFPAVWPVPFSEGSVPTRSTLASGPGPVQSHTNPTQKGSKCSLMSCHVWNASTFELEARWALSACWRHAVELDTVWVLRRL